MGIRNIQEKLEKYIHTYIPFFKLFVKTRNINIYILMYNFHIEKFRQIVDCAAKEPKVVVQNSNAQHTATSLSFLGSHKKYLQ